MNTLVLAFLPYVILLTYNIASIQMFFFFFPCKAFEWSEFI